MNNNIGFFQSCFFALLRPFRRVISWEELESVFIYLSAISVDELSDKLNLNDFHTLMGNGLAAYLFKANRKVSAAQNNVIFGAIDLIALSPTLQFNLKKFNESYDSKSLTSINNEIYKGIVDELASYGYKFASSH